MQGREIIINDEFYINAENDCVVLSGKFGNPEFKTYTFDIPGRDGLLDLTDSLDGEVHYNNRSVEFRLFIAGKRLGERLNQINSYHGQFVKFSSSYDNDYYYNGRLSVDVEEKKSNYAYVTLSFDCEPFKIAKNPTTSIHIVRGEQTLKINYTGKPAAAEIKLIQKGDETDSPIALKVKKDDINSTLFNIPNTFNFIMKTGINEIELESGRIVDGKFTPDSSSLSKIALSYIEVRI